MTSESENFPVEPKLAAELITFANELKAELVEVPFIEKFIELNKDECDLLNLVRLSLLAKDSITRYFEKEEEAEELCKKYEEFSLKLEQATGIRVMFTMENLIRSKGQGKITTMRIWALITK
jgi:hypothetical protein